MVDAAVSLTIEKLREFVTQQVNIRIGVKDGIEWLKDELGYLLISVRAAEAHQDKDHIRLWTDSVRVVANQAVIILERFSAQQEEDAAAEQGGILDHILAFCCRFICICNKEANLYDIGKEIEALKEKIIAIKKRREEYCINDIIIAPSTVHQRKRTVLRSASFDHEEDVVGFDDDVQTLLAQLGNKDLSLGFISIHRMGGLGKSTLASKLYHSRELSHFKRRAWVYVSKDYDIKLVLRKVINAFNGHEPDLLNNMEDFDLLRRHLRKMLDGNRYLVVIDDVWNVQVWDQIKNAFPDKNNGSRVVITTRSSVVANDVHETCFVHKLPHLTKDESWQLFCKKAKPTPNLELLGKEMVGKCGGLPLAIVILSGLLRRKKTYEFWSYVKDHLWRKLKDKSSEIQEVLSLSYDDMYSHVKHCLLYLARYPEDHIIEVLELKWLWIAEEFISEADEEDGVDMEDVAEDFLNELINRNMIQIVLMSIEGQVARCRVHDLIRDLAIEKAMEKKELGFFDSSKHQTNPIDSLQGQSRHAIYNGIGEYLKLHGPNSDNSELLSIAVTAETDSEVGVEQLKLMFSRFTNLQVLNLTLVVTYARLPKEIGNLVYLKFLGLMGSYSEKALVIPPSVGNLKRLQTLCGWTFFLGSVDYKFPKEICELKELRHLKFKGIHGNFNISRDQTKLRTIETITYKEWFHIDTINLTNLRTLYIVEAVDKEEEYSLGSIANLTSLQQLFLSFGGGNVSTLQPLSSCKHLKKVWFTCSIKDVAELSFLPDSVTNLKLFLTRFTEDPMPTLGSLPNLTVLSLVNGSFLGDKMVCSAKMFPCLQFLRLDALDLEEFQVDDGALPSLKAFKSYSSRLIDMLPQRITSLPSVNSDNRFGRGGSDQPWIGSTFSSDNFQIGSNWYSDNLWIF